MEPAGLCVFSLQAGGSGLIQTAIRKCTRPGLCLPLEGAPQGVTPGFLGISCHLDLLCTATERLVCPLHVFLGRGEAKDSDILLGRDSYLLEPTEWPPGSQASCGVGERTRDCSPGHTGREGPQLAMTGASQGFNGNSERLYFGGLQNHCRW